LIACTTTYHHCGSDYNDNDFYHYDLVNYDYEDVYDADYHDIYDDDYYYYDYNYFHDVYDNHIDTW
jgi:hypothetical protein